MNPEPHLLQRDFARVGQAQKADHRHIVLLLAKFTVGSVTSSTETFSPGGSILDPSDPTVASDAATPVSTVNSLLMGDSDQ
jgi:hypothetical protein